MKTYKVILKCDDVIAIVKANDEEEAREKYWNDEIEEYEASPEQPFVEVIEETDTPAKDQNGREPDKVKPLAQYLDEYIGHEAELGRLTQDHADMYYSAYDSWCELLEQALDAYQSTENVTIKIERKP